MKVNKVTITGPDNGVDPQKLVSLTNRFPFVEWGILFSNSRTGQDRFPTNDWIETLLALKPNNLSAHFCGWHAKEVLEKQNFSLITQLNPGFRRIQLNYNFKNSVLWNLEPLIEFAKGETDRSIILQYNGSNKTVLDNLRTKELPANIHFLYDSSGGRGTEIKTLHYPLGTQYTGYSGGLAPDNIENILNILFGMNDISSIWIDLESGARTDNKFDLEKVEDILNKCERIINNEN